MVSFSEAQVLGWISAWLWPFFRVMGLFTAAPVLNQKAIPKRVRLALSLLIVIAAQPSMPEMPNVALNSPDALMVIAQQVLIGLTMGFAARVVFAAIEFAGEIVGLQMGLNFASFFDPMSGGQATAVSRFYGTCAAWL
ncbi:MAG: flagellar biosynthetic protein FliR, partial [Burkholderiales bacterium]|nr:flagellar biosynthetic protein FliR [Burkholderiales bacterium]